MKFRFKIQQYQTDAVDSVVRVFQGQPKVEGLTYRRDIGETPTIIAPAQMQMSLLPPDQGQASFFDPIDDTGFLNETLHLTDADLLRNIRAIQTENNIFIMDIVFPIRMEKQ